MNRNSVTQISSPKKTLRVVERNTFCIKFIKPPLLKRRPVKEDAGSRQHNNYVLRKLDGDHIRVCAKCNKSVQLSINIDCDAFFEMREKYTWEKGGRYTKSDRDRHF